MITATILFLTLSQSMSKRELLDCFAYTDAREEKACVDAWQARSKEIQGVASENEKNRTLSFEQQRYRASGLNLVTAAVVLWNMGYLELLAGTRRQPPRCAASSIKSSTSATRR